VKRAAKAERDIVTSTASDATVQGCAGSRWMRAMATDLAVLERSEPSRLRGGVVLEAGPCQSRLTRPAPRPA
jgi:hypothetical protein